MNYFDTVAPIEVLWVVLAAFALALRIRHRWYSGTTLRQAREGGTPDDDPGLIVGGSNIRHDNERTVRISAYLFVGLRAATLPSNPNTSEFGAIFIGLLFTVLIVIEVVSGLLDERDRKLLDTAMEQYERTVGEPLPDKPSDAL